MLPIDKYDRKGWTYNFLPIWLHGYKYTVYVLLIDNCVILIKLDFYLFVAQKSHQLVIVQPGSESSSTYSSESYLKTKLIFILTQSLSHSHMHTHTQKYERLGCEQQRLQKLYKASLRCSSRATSIDMWSQTRKVCYGQYANIHINIMIGD